MRSLGEGNLTKENWSLSNTEKNRERISSQTKERMPTSETQEVVNASVPTAEDQGQVVSKMIYLHVTKPHSLTQMAICSKERKQNKESISMDEQGTARVLFC